MAPKTVKSTRNPELIRGVGKVSRSQMYHKRGLWAIKAKHGGKFPQHEKATASPAAAEKAPKFYPADDVKKPLSNTRKPKPTKLRLHCFHSFLINFHIHLVIFLFCFLFLFGFVKSERALAPGLFWSYWQGGLRGRELFSWSSLILDCFLSLVNFCSAFHSFKFNAFMWTSSMLIYLWFTSIDLHTFIVKFVFMQC